MTNRYLATYIFFPILLIVSICIATYSYFEIAHLESLERGQGLSTLQYLVPQLTPKVINHDDEEIDALCSLSTLDDRIKTIVVFNKQKNIISHQGNASIFDDQQLIEQKLTEQFSRFKGKYDTSYLIAPIPQKDELFEYANFDKKKKSKFYVQDPIGWVLIGIDKSNSQIRQHNAYIVSGLLILVSLLIGMAIYRYLSNTFVAPYERLNQMLAGINNGDLDKIQTLSTHSPFSEIGSTLENLINRLKKTEHELNQGVELANSDLQGHLETLEERNVQLCMSIKDLKETSRSKNEFIATMSHEIRTPINGIIGFANVLCETHLTPVQAEYIDVIKTSAQNLTHIISDILDYTKIEAGELALETIPFDLRNCIDEIMLLLMPTIDKKRLKTYVTVSHKVPILVKGDPVRFKQILTNLVGNAVKFTESGYIEIYVDVLHHKQSHHQLEISVTDSGIGLSQKEKSKLFHVFKQANNTIQRRFGGTGLGLIITQRLVHKMNGSITVNSETDIGSTFKVSIELEAITQNTTSLKDYSNHKVWVCDNDSRSRHSVQEILALFRIVPTYFESYTALETDNIDYVFVHIESKATQEIAEKVSSQFGERCLCYYHAPQAINEVGKIAKLIRAPINIQKIQEVIGISTLGLPENNTHIPLRRHQRQLLIAEDDPVNQFLIRSILGKHDILFTIVSNGADLVEKANTEKYDLLLLDMQMPKLDGFSAAQEVRQSSVCNRQTPIIAVSANFTDEQKSKCLELGINDIIFKPFDEVQLVRRITLWTPEDTAPINWPMSVKAMGGRPEHAKTLINEYIRELRDDFTEMQRCVKIENRKAFLSIVHKQLGGASYVGVPQLKQCLKALEKQAAKAHPNPQKEKLLIDELFTKINLVLQYYDDRFKKLIQSVS